MTSEMAVFLSGMSIGMCLVVVAEKLPLWWFIPALAATIFGGLYG